MVEKKYKDKAALVADLNDKLNRASAVVVTEYRGLKAGDLVKLRSALRPSQIEVLVVKNSLFRRAAEGTTSEAISTELAGPTAIALSYGEPAEAAKLLAKGAKDYDKFNLTKGVVDKMVVDDRGLAALATLPSKPEMQSQFAGVLEGFVGEFVYLIEATMREFAGLLEAKADKESASS
ncbi:MAG TPA: 50S ribosomal protein L10 [Abditibacteriaceae bacterium]|jgi:large subunit ribosomal protein L10